MFKIGKKSIPAFPDFKKKTSLFVFSFCYNLLINIIVILYLNILRMIVFCIVLFSIEMVNQYLNVPRLSTATAFFLLGIFDAQRSFKGTIYVGMATTLAITLRLHDHNSSDGRPPIEQEARKRVCHNQYK